jgi:hypothetical protein
MSDNGSVNQDLVSRTFQGSIEGVKFFTKELWLSAQNLNNLKAYDQEWQQAFDEYVAQLKQLRHRLSDVAFSFFLEGDVHDGELLTLVVTDGSRPAPLAESVRIWKKPGASLKSTRLDVGQFYMSDFGCVNQDLGVIWGWQLRVSF